MGAASDRDPSIRLHRLTGTGWRQPERPYESTNAAAEEGLHASLPAHLGQHSGVPKEASSGSTGGDSLLSGQVRRVLRALLLVTAVYGGTGGPTQIRGQAPDSTSTVRGTVLEHETGIPLPGAVVSLRSEDGGSGT